MTGVETHAGEFLGGVLQRLEALHSSMVDELLNGALGQSANDPGKDSKPALGLLKKRATNKDDEYQERGGGRG